MTAWNQSGMKGKVGGFQNPGVCLQAFPSFPSPSPLFFHAVILCPWTPRKRLLRRLIRYKNGATIFSVKFGRNVDKNRYLYCQNQNSRHEARRGGGTRRKLDSQKALPYLWPKSVIFPTLYMTWLKIDTPFMTVVADTVALNISCEELLLMVSSMNMVMKK